MHSKTEISSKTEILKKVSISISLTKSPDELLHKTTGGQKPSS